MAVSIDVSKGKDVHSLLSRLLSRVQGAQTLLVTDRDATQVLKVSRGSGDGDLAGEEALAASYNVLSDQLAKLQLGKNKHVSCFFKDRLLVHINLHPLVVTVVGTAAMNLGVLLSLVPDLKKGLEPLNQTIERKS